MMLNKWLSKWIVLLLSTLCMLAACHSPHYNQSQGNVADVKIRAAAARHKSDMDAKPKPALLVKQGMYVDTTPRNLSSQPAWLQNHIVIRGDQLPFSYYSRTIASGAGSSILTKYQVGLDPAIPVSVNYTGSVKGALDLIAAKTGYVYAVFGKQIYWQAFVTKTFDIAFMPGASDYLMGKASGGSGSSAAAAGSGGGNVSNYVSSDYSNSEYSNLSGKLSIWTDLETTIRQLLSPDGKVTVSQATTTVTVRDRPTNVELIGQYIRNLNKNLSKQVLVKIQVLEVALFSDFNFGINWQLITKAFNKTPFTVSANYGTPITITNLLANNGASTPAIPTVGTNAAVDPYAITNGHNGIPSYTILLNALTQQGKTSLVSEPRVVCLNNQVSVVRVVTSKGYVASIQNTSLASGGTAPTSTVTSQITPGTVITGLTLYILPKILDKKIYLQVNADLSTNDGFTQATAGSTTAGGPPTNTIQLPNITEKHFNQRSMIHSGDTLILSGFRQVGNVANAAQFLNSQALGGKGSQEANRETIVLITPIIL